MPGRDKKRLKRMKLKADEQDHLKLKTRRYINEAAARYRAEKVLKRDVNVAQAR